MLSGNRVICDCCGRQIVTYKADEKQVIGPRDKAKSIGFGRHCCHVCYPDYEEQQQENERRGL